MSPYRNITPIARRSRLWRFRMWLARLIAPVDIELVDAPPSAGIEPTWYPPLPADIGDRISLPIEHIAAADGVNIVCACWMCDEARAHTVERDVGPNFIVVRSGLRKRPKGPPPVETP